MLPSKHCAQSAEQLTHALSCKYLPFPQSVNLATVPVPPPTGIINS